MNNTKQDVLEFLKKGHVDFEFSNINDFSTISIANGFHISRSLASQYLNALFREGKVVKIDSRPVYYFCKSVFEMDFEISLKTTCFASVDELKKYLCDQKETKYAFENVIGYDGTLGEIISQIKAASLYPTNSGLNYILYGETGTGKKLLEDCAFEYVKNHISKVIKREICDCIDTDFFENFCKAIEKVDDGIVVINRFNLLYEKDCRRVENILQNKKYIDSEGNVTYIRCSFVLLYDGVNIDELGSILNYFPIKCYIPNFKQRYTLEKEQIIISFFRKESYVLNKEIKISYALMKYFMNQAFQNNLDGLKNQIQEVCARANVESGEIKAGLNHLPEQYIVIDNASLNRNVNAYQDWINVNNYVQNDSSQEVIDYFNRIIELLKSNENKQNVIRTCGEILDGFYDKKIYGDSYTSDYVIPYTASINEILNRVMLTYNYVLPEHCGSIISYYCYVKKMISGSIKEWYLLKKATLTQIAHDFANDYPDLNVIVDRIVLSCSYLINIDFDEIGVLILFIMFLNYNSFNKNKLYTSLIICHGTSTAQSISNTVNSLVGQHIFEYVDMPIDKTMADVADYVERFIQRFRISNDVLVLVDMGSLEELGANLSNIENNIYILNNVSTPMALSVATKIIQNASINQIYESCKRNFNSGFKFYENKKKQDALLFVSDNGKKMADKILDTFTGSLPKHIDVQMFSYDLNDLKSQRYIEHMQDEYNVLLVIGAVNIENLPYEYISIENLVKENEINRISKILGGYLSQDEIYQFRENLIYNFSLQSIIDNMSVLDAKKVLTYTKNAVNLLQNEIQHTFSLDMLPGIYIHICFMVERLLTKEPLTKIENEDEFVEKNKDFIVKVKKCFKTLCGHYGICLTNAEIKYLYDYIANDRRTNNESFSDSNT